MWSTESASTVNQVGSSIFLEAKTINLSTSQFPSKGLYKSLFLRMLEIKAQHKRNTFERSALALIVKALSEDDKNGKTSEVSQLVVCFGEFLIEDHGYRLWHP